MRPYIVNQWVQRVQTFTVALILLGPQRHICPFAKAYSWLANVEGSANLATLSVRRNEIQKRRDGYELAGKRKHRGRRVELIC